MATGDIREIDMTKATNLDGKKIRLVGDDGKGYWIEKEDLAAVVGELLKSDGYLKFKDYGQLTTPDFTTKDVQIGFGYSNSDDGSGFAGLFLSVSNGSARFQIKSNLNAPQLKFRQTNFNNDDTTGWVEIKI